MRNAILLLILLMTGSVYAQRSGNHEVSFGAGVMFPNEDSPLNVPGEKPLSSGIFGTGVYRLYLTELFALGIRGSFSSAKLEEYYYKKDITSAPTDAGFSLSMMNAGLEPQFYLSSRGALRPYLSFQISYCEYNLTSSSFGKLKNQGFLAGGGAGIRVKISDTMLMFAEASALFGTAEWKQKPFNNSLNTEFDPSSIRVLLSAAFMIR